MNCKEILVSCLLLTSCGSSGSDYPESIHKEITFYAVNVNCQFDNEVVKGTLQKFKDAGIQTAAVLYCVEWDKAYEFGQTKQALNDLTKEFGNGHFLMPKFGNYFDGLQSGDRSISVAVVGRLDDSVEQAAHEIAHQFGATHDFSNCNLMGYRRCGYPAKFNDKAIGEMQ